MATLESVLTVFAPHRCSNKHCFSAKPPDTTKLHVSTSLSSLSHTLVFSPTLSCNPFSRGRHRFDFELLCSALQEVATEGKPEQTHQTNVKKKLYVFNLPWTLSAADIKSLFGQCGSVTDVEIIKNKDGRISGYAFVTMASGDQAQAAIDKLDSHEISGRIIRVELAKRFKKPPPPRPPGPPAVERCYKIYASNLAWKVRSNNLREFITENFKRPVTARVVFDSSSGGSAGYGFVSFDTKEEAEDAISVLDGKELMGRPLRLKFSQKTVEESGSEKNDEKQGCDDQLEES